MIIYFCSVQQSPTKDQITDLETELKKAGVGDGIKAFDYVRKVREISQMSTLGGAVVGADKGGRSIVGGWDGGFGALSNRVSRNSPFKTTPWHPVAQEKFSASLKFTDRLKEGGLDNLLSGVKNFLPQSKNLPVTRLVEALMDPSAAATQALQDTDEYLFLDPRQSRSAAPGPGPGKAKRMVHA